MYRGHRKKTATWRPPCGLSVKGVKHTGNSADNHRSRTINLANGSTPQLWAVDYRRIILGASNRVTRLLLWRAISAIHNVHRSPRAIHGISVLWIRWLRFSVRARLHIARRLRAAATGFKVQGFNGKRGRRVILMRLISECLRRIIFHLYLSRENVFSLFLFLSRVMSRAKETI